ncbi:MAG: M48 family metallopeptidase [Candidatus Dormibacteraceae bacterium]
MAVQPVQPEPWHPPVRVISSPRRRRTVQARLRSGVLEVLVPASMPQRERLRWVGIMRDRIERQLRRARPTDERLEDRARTINQRYFGGALRWNSIAFAEQGRRWGSCTFTAGVIRISTRAANLPPFVLDYLIVHELAHLEHADHGPAFWELVMRYQLTERARGYLMAIDHGLGEDDREAGEVDGSED